MRFIFDINHPAHAHFFRCPINILKDEGHEIMVTSRDKEMAVPLLDEMNIQHKTISSQNGSGILSLGKELWMRDKALYKVTRTFKPDVLAAIGGTFIAHVGWFTRIPSLVFYDTENARLQNTITYPFSHRVIVPRCYESWVPKNHIRYDGYHELSYLHPNRFNPDIEIARKNGYDSNQNNFFIRTVSWQANHDIMDSGWSETLLRNIVSFLSKTGKVHISSESRLPEDLLRYKYNGKVSEVHHLMAFCRMFVGESATMASECAVLGIPALYIANIGRGYTNEQEKRYQLVKNLHTFNWEDIHLAMKKILHHPREYYSIQRVLLLQETIDVAPFVAKLLVNTCQK